MIVGEFGSVEWFSDHGHVLTSRVILTVRNIITWMAWNKETKKREHMIVALSSVLGS